MRCFNVSEVRPKANLRPRLDNKVVLSSVLFFYSFQWCIIPKKQRETQEATAPDVDVRSVIIWHFVHRARRTDMLCASMTISLKSSDASYIITYDTVSGLRRPVPCGNHLRSSSHSVLLIPSIQIGSTAVGDEVQGLGSTFNVLMLCFKWTLTLV